MAAETTSTTYATNKLSYMLAQSPLPANIAKIVLMPLCNDDDIAGEPTTTRQYAVEADLGPATAGTEGTPITTNTALSFDSAIQGTPVEGALLRAVITDRAVEVRFPGMTGVFDLLQRGTFEQQMAMVRPEVMRLLAPCLEKKETDGLAILPTFSQVAGTTLQPFTAADAFTALYLYATQEGLTGDNLFMLTPNQAKELRTDVGITGGGLGGGVWFQQADAAFINGKSLPVNGLQGTFLGRPVYEYSHSLRVLSDTNTNVNGALIARGIGSPSTGQLGGVGFVRNGGMKVRLEYDVDIRGLKIVVSLEYAALKVRDAHGVRIRTGAPA